MKLAEQQAALGAQRRSMIGGGNRSEKIRTYNFKANRVTDHRINLDLHKLDQVMGGDLDELVEALSNADRAAGLERHLIDSSRGSQAGLGAPRQAWVGFRRGSMLRCMLAGALGLRRLDLYLQFDRRFPKPSSASFARPVARRAHGEPVAYVVGHRSSWRSTSR